MTPIEKILNNYSGFNDLVTNQAELLYDASDVLEAMKEAYELGRLERSSLNELTLKIARADGFIEGRDKALDWASINYDIDSNDPDYNEIERSILSGKTHESLQP